MRITDNDIRDRVIQDFGSQWKQFTRNEGYYASTEFLRDMFHPILDLSEVRGARVGDIGSGTGRIVRMLLELDAEHVTAVEPSDASEILMQNLASERDRLRVLEVRGDQIPAGLGLDMLFSIGVLHHIPDPLPVVRAAHAALKPGGKIAIWLYGKEGNWPYLWVAVPMRALTRRIPHRALVFLSTLLELPLRAYIRACKRFPLPLRRYMLEVIGRLSPEQRRLVVYDQLNPAFAKYYRRNEAVALLEAGGFENIRVYHRLGYSWSLVGVKN